MKAISKLSISTPARIVYDGMDAVSCYNHCKVLEKSAYELFVDGPDGRCYWVRSGLFIPPAQREVCRLRI